MAEATGVLMVPPARTPARSGRIGAAVWRFCRRKPLGAIGGAVVIAIAVIGALAPYIAPHDPKELVGPRYQPPGGDFILGTDLLGRDMLSRLVYGARLSLTVGIASVSLGVTAGLALGVLTGYLGGGTDLLVQRFVDSVQSFPTLVLAMALVAVFGASVHNVIMAIAIVLIPGSTRTIRAAVLALRHQAFVEAATAAGASHVRIMLVHILPNTLAPYLVLFSLAIGNAIITEASLSFLGLGVPPDEPSWGGMMTYAGVRFISVAPWVAILPGSAIGLAVYGFNLFGDALRDLLDPRLRHR